MLLFLIAPTMYSQSVRVRGSVKDSNNQPIVGALVYVHGTMNYTLTGQDGTYEIYCSLTATLVFSCLSYLEQAIPVNGSTVIDVVLQDDPDFFDGYERYSFASIVQPKVNNTIFRQFQTV